MPKHVEGQFLVNEYLTRWAEFDVTQCAAYSIKASINAVSYILCRLLLLQVEQHYVTEFVFGVRFYLSQHSNLL